MTFIPLEDRCCAITKKRTRCKRPRMPGFKQCDTHGIGYKYFIQFQWRRDNPNGPSHDWKSWRDFAVWPKLFDTAEAARKAMDTPLLFANMENRRKLSASVQRTKKRAFVIADRIDNG